MGSALLSTPTTIRRGMFMVFAARPEIVVDLLLDGNIALADRNDAVRPANAKRSDVRPILQIAAENFELLAALWESIHGNRA
jgi:hypothetical protein